jgi:hypothetical protein
MKKTVGLEKARAKALNEFAVKEFFDMHQGDGGVQHFARESLQYG